VSRILSSLPSKPVLNDVFERYPDLKEAFQTFRDKVLKTNGVLTEHERETIATHVSNLNSCKACTIRHSENAKMLLGSQGTSDSNDPETSDRQARSSLEPILSYAGKLTLQPTSLTAEDAEAVYAAGWCEEALLTSITIVSFMNMANRVVLGVGGEAAKVEL